MGRKQMYGYFKQKTDENCLEKTLRGLKTGNLQRETESPQITAQNDGIRTINVKVKIDKTQENSK